MFFRYGFAASFTLVFVSEIGDKTFFMAGICAMRVGRLKAFLGAALALAVSPTTLPLFMLTKSQRLSELRPSGIGELWADLVECVLPSSRDRS
jgi:hypothetical protein